MTPREAPPLEPWMLDLEALFDERWGDVLVEHRMLHYAMDRRVAALRLRRSS